MRAGMPVSRRPSRKAEIDERPESPGRRAGFSRERSDHRRTRPRRPRRPRRRRRRPGPARRRRRPDRRHAHGQCPHARIERRRAGRAIREDDVRQDGRRRADAGAAGDAAGLPAGADRGPLDRLPEALDEGHRQPRREGRAAGRDRVARGRPAAFAGDRGAPADGRQPRSRQELGRALGGAAQEGRRVAAGARRAAQRRDPGRRQRRRRRGECAAPAPAAGFHAGDGAVRRRHHAAQRRYRRPHRFERQDALRADADGPAARLRQCAAGICAARQGRAEGRRHAVGIARPELFRGLVFATVSTLLFVPVVYAAIHDRLARRAERQAHRHAGLAPTFQEG